jgi:transposase
MLHHRRLEEQQMTESTVAPVDRIVTIGVDTHSDIHVAVALDRLGRRLGTTTIPTTPAGYRQLESWAREFGQVDAFGIEGTGSWGAGLVRLLRGHGHRLVEVNRPDRGARHRQGKNDPLDAEAAARAVLAGTATAQPKAGEGLVEMIRALQVVRRSAQKARSQAANQLHALLVTAPAELREQPRSTTLAGLVRIASRWRTGGTPDTHLLVTKHALRSLARRHQDLTEEIRDLDAQLGRLVQQAAPSCWRSKDLDHSPALRCSWPSASTPSGCAPNPPSPTSAAWPAAGLLRQDQPPPAQRGSMS